MSAVRIQLVVAFFATLCLANSARSAFTPNWSASPGTVLINQSYSVVVGATYSGTSYGFVVEVQEMPSGPGGAGSGNTGSYVTASINNISHSQVASYTYHATFHSYAGEYEYSDHSVDVHVNHAPTGSLSAPSTVPPNTSFTVSIHAHDDDFNLRDMGIRYQGFGQISHAWVEWMLDADDSATVTSPATPGTIMKFRAEVNDESMAGYTGDFDGTQVRVVAPAVFAWASGTKSFVYDGLTHTVSAADVSTNPSGATFGLSGSLSGTAANSYNITATANGNYSGSNTLTWTIQPKPVTFSWSVAPDGKSVSVTTNPTNATCNQIGTWSASAPGPYSATVTAYGNFSGTETFNWTIANPPVTSQISVTPTSATAPGSTTVTWSSANASSVSVVGPGINSTAASGSQPLSGLAVGSYTYTITAQGVSGPAVHSATFRVDPVASVSATIGVSPTRMTAPGTTTVTWTSSNATSVTVTGSGLNSTALNGNPQIAGLAAGSYTYTITAQGPNGPVTNNATFIVDPPGVVSAISVSPSNATAQGSTTVTWSSSNASSVAVTGYGLNSTAANGSQLVSGLPPGPQVYTITAQGTGGPVVHTATVTVADATLTATPSSASTGPATTTLAWTSSGATQITITGPNVPASTTFPVSGNASGTVPIASLPESPNPYVFTLVALTPGGNITKTANFSVGGAVSNAPTVNWTQIPDYVAPNQSFSVQAEGHDADGNLTGVQILRNGNPFASAGAGNGYLSTTAATPYSPSATGSVVFSATVTDATGKSATISHNVVVSASGGSAMGEGSLPGTATLVGTLDGEVTVDNHGAANYSIPLKLPPGRAGMEPKLALTYNSTGGNGPVGLGWSLSTGFPQAITRGRSIMARDGIVRGINFDSNDKYYLDGKRLLLTGGTGGYGQPNSEYRTEVDSFVKITATGSGGNIETFTVVDKMGTQMVFGKYNTASDGYQAGAYDINGNNVIDVGEVDTLAYAYALKHVQDAVGNSVDFTYSTANDGEYQLSDITYTGSTAPTVQPQAHVRMVYDLSVVPGNPTGRTARLDQPTRYIARRGFPLRKRLDRIVSDVGPGPALSSVYALTYDYSADSGPTRLRSVQGYFRNLGSGDLEAAPPTNITWSGNVWSYSNVANNLVAGGQPTGSNETFAFGDVNGDGKDDFIDMRGSSAVFVSLSTGNGFGTPTAWTTNGVWSGPQPVMKVCDVNGDGLKDIVYGNPLEGQSKTLRVLVSTGTQFVPLGAVLFSFTDEFRDTPASGGGMEFQKKELLAVTNRICAADFTGDGRDDILIHRYDGKLTLLKSTGTGFAVQQNLDVGAHALQGTPMWELWGLTFLGVHVTQDFSVSMIPCDLNGDGIMDYAWVESTQRWNSWNVYGMGSAENASGGKTLFAVTSQPGVGFSTMSSVVQYGWGASSMASTPYRQTSFTIMPGDVNGDGLTDFTVLIPAEQIDDGYANGPYYRVLRHQIYISQGAAAAPVFRLTDGGIQPTVNIGGQQAAPWFDKIDRGRWVNDYYSSIGQLVNPNNQRSLFLTLGLSSPSDNVTMLDVNADGLADYVWYVDNPAAQAGWWVMYSRGETFSAPAPVPLGWNPTAKLPPGAMSMTISSRSSLDFNGDGIPDYTYYSGPSDQSAGINGFHVSSGKRGDRVTTVSNGLNSPTTVWYLPITDDTIYTPGAPSAASYPIRELRSPSYVVSDVFKDSGGSASSHFTYQYSGNRLDLSGRGPLGFHSFTTLDAQSTIIKYQFLAQSFPMTGLAQREQTYRYWPDGANTDFRLISSHDNTVVFDKVGASGATLYPFISQAIESRWEDSTTVFLAQPMASASSQPEFLFASYATIKSIQGPPHISITAQSQFDNHAVQLSTGLASYYASDINGTSNVVTGTNSGSVFNSLPGNITNGNLTKLSTDYGGGVTETVDTVYVPPSGNLTALVDNMTTTVSSPGYGSEVAPIKRYMYWGSTPLIAAETLDAPGNQLDLTTTYIRENQLGRVTQVSISGTDLLAVGEMNSTFATRRADTFDSIFADLPTSEFNAYDHHAVTAYNPVLGKPSSVTGPNGDQTTFLYDALGRVTEVHDVLKDLYTKTTYTADTSLAIAPPSGVERGVTVSSAYRVLVTTTAKPAITTYYDRLGRPIRTVKGGFNGSIATTDTAYDDLGRIIAVSKPYPSGGPVLWTKTFYDALGRVRLVLAPILTGTTTTYTETTTTYKGRATIVSVDAPNLGNVDAQVNSSVVDAKGRTIAVWNADNVPDFTDMLGTTATPPSIAFALDGFGRMRDTALRGQTSHIIATYDAFGRQISLSDPDKGYWTYLNSALGYVLQQADARSTVTTTSYDRLGRSLTRSTAETAASGGAVETASWFYYDSVADDASHRIPFIEKGWIGALQREECKTMNAPGYAAANSESKTAHYYDTKGRPLMDLTTIDGKWFYTSTGYTEPDGSDYNRVTQIRNFWRPSGHEGANDMPYVWNDFGYTYAYDNSSYLLSVTDSNTPGRIWWVADPTAGYDYMDRPVLVRKGSGHWTQRTYRPGDGVLTGIATGASAGSTLIQNLSFNYDGLGNLTSRSGIGGPETFGYDPLNRLITRNGVTIAAYADNGNIDWKKDVTGASSGTYGYSANNKPHAVRAAWSYAMDYDLNGNLSSRTKGAETWSFAYAGFDKPRWMARTDASGTKGSEFLYNANRSRTVQLEFNAMSGGVPSHYLRKRIYALGSTLEVNYDFNDAAPSGASPWNMGKVRVYVPGPEGVIGSREFTPSAPVGQQEKAYVYHYDQLGSIESITDFGSTTAVLSSDAGNKAGRFSEDAWGQRRNPTSLSGPPTSTDDGGPDSITPRGFTGHEMLDDLGFVHMNGRIYDPLLGRMLSADIVVQLPGDLQSYNRYSYVRNNPASSSDATGWYEENGHLYTPFIVARAAGLSVDRANIIAAYAMQPDYNRETSAFTTIPKTAFDLIFHPFRIIGAQMNLHLLNGLSEQRIEHVRSGLSSEISNRNISDSKRGIFAHPFGDSWAHMDRKSEHMFSPGIGHLFQGHTPDTISATAASKAAYKQYANALESTFSKLSDSPGEPKIMAELSNIIDAMTTGSLTAKQESEKLLEYATSLGYEDLGDVPLDNAEVADVQKSIAAMVKNSKSTPEGKGAQKGFFDAFSRADEEMAKRNKGGIPDPNPIPYPRGERPR